MLSQRGLVLTCASASAALIAFKTWNKRSISSLPLASIKLNQSLQKRLSKGTNHLMLHFDINKTIVMADAVQNKQLTGVFNDILAECSWGTVYGIDEVPDYYHFNRSFIIGNCIWMPSEPYNITPIRPDECSVSFMEWVKSSFPYPDGKTDQVIKRMYLYSRDAKLRYA